MASVTSITVRWDGVQGATGYEIRKNGVAIGTRGPRARTHSLPVEGTTKMEIVDLPARSSVQEVNFQQEQL
jgi:hypothetical protein